MSSADPLEAAVEDSVRARLEAMAVVAVAAVVGRTDVLAIRKERIRTRQNASDGPDLEFHAPATLWRKLRAGSDADAPVRIRTMSEFGVEREREYATAAALGRAVVSALDEAGARSEISDACTNRV